VVRLCCWMLAERVCWESVRTEMSVVQVPAVGWSDCMEAEAEEPWIAYAAAKDGEEENGCRISGLSYSFPVSQLSPKNCGHRTRRQHRQCICQCRNKQITHPRHQNFVPDSGRFNRLADISWVWKVPISGALEGHRISPDSVNFGAIPSAANRAASLTAKFRETALFSPSRVLNCWTRRNNYGLERPWSQIVTFHLNGG